MSAPVTTRSLVELTLAASTRDRQMAKPDGQRVNRLTDGVSIKPVTTHADAGAIVPFATNLTIADELASFLTVANTIPARASSRINSGSRSPSPAHRGASPRRYVL